MVFGDGTLAAQTDAPGRPHWGLAGNPDRHDRRHDTRIDSPLNRHPPRSTSTAVRALSDEVEAEEQARERGTAALEKVYAEQRHPGLRLDIRVVRLATTDEIEFCRWNQETLAREQMERRV